MPYFLNNLSLCKKNTQPKSLMPFRPVSKVKRLKVLLFFLLLLLCYIGKTESEAAQAAAQKRIKLKARGTDDTWR